MRNNIINDKETQVKGKMVKRGYNFPTAIIKAWEELHVPSKDFSPSAAAAFMIYLELSPEARERLRKLDYAYKNITTLHRQIARGILVDEGKRFTSIKGRQVEL